MAKVIHNLSSNLESLINVQPQFRGTYDTRSKQQNYNQQPKLWLRHPCPCKPSRTSPSLLQSLDVCGHQLLACIYCNMSCNGPVALLQMPLAASSAAAKQSEGSEDPRVWDSCQDLHGE